MKKEAMAMVLSISLLLLLLFLLLALPEISSSSRLLDFKGKDSNLDVKNIHEVNLMQVTQISWHPRAFLYVGFLSNEECDHLISLAHGKLEKARVIDGVTGESAVTKGRISSGMFLRRDQDETVTRIEERIATWTMLPKDNGESIQILNYGIEENYEPHYDYYLDKTKLVTGGHRIATVLMYSSNVSRGGETVFPRSETKDGQSKDTTWSDCAATGYAIKPVKGNALLFFNLHLDAAPDESSLHGDCMVLEGQKLSATKWIHAQAFASSKEDLSLPNNECTDEDDMCSKWAANGECQRNPVFMLGTTDYYGSCRRSCGVC